MHKPTVRILLTICVFALALWCLWIARPVLLLMVCAVLIAAALAPAVECLTNRFRFPRGLAVGFCLLVLIGGLAGAVTAVTPPMVSGVNGLVADAPGYVDDLEKSDEFRKLDKEYKIGDKLKDTAEKLPSKLGSTLGVVQAATFGFLGALISIITTIALAAYLMLDGPKMLRFARTHLPEGHGDRLARLVLGSRKAVSGYLLAVAALGLVAGIVDYIVLSILGVPGALPLAALMAAGSLIPMIGAPVAAVIVAIVAVFTSVQALVVWIIVFIGYQQLENNILQPIIYKRTVELHPLVVIPAVMIGTAQMGILGALLSVPLAAVAQVAVKDWWTNRNDDASLIPTDDDRIAQLAENVKNASAATA